MRTPSPFDTMYGYYHHDETASTSTITYEGTPTMGDDGQMKDYPRPPMPKSTTNPFKRHAGYENLPARKKKSK